MTLNVTVLTQTIIYQSADFKLTDFNTGQPMPDPSPKTVTFTYSAWNGFITYTGVGRWQDRDVSSFITEWLTGRSEPSMAEVAYIVADRGTRLLREYEQAYHHRQGHTFTLVGFEEHQPKVYVISNFEDCFGRSDAVTDDFLSITTRPLGQGKKAVVIVTGHKPAVSADDKRILGSIAAKFPTDGLRIRRRMAQLNSDAASRSNGGVSPECAVLSFNIDGTGAMLLDPNAVAVPLQFPHIMHGVDVNKAAVDALRHQGIDASGARMVLVGYRSVRPGQPQIASIGPCNYAIIAPDSSAGYDLAEITSTEFELGAARAISDRGQIIGTGRASPGLYPHIPWSYLNGHIETLNFPGLAAAVNDSGHVVAVLQGANAPNPSTQRAYCYNDGQLIELPLYEDEPGPWTRSDSEASAINNSSVMAGSVAVQRDISERLRVLAAVFRVDQPTVVFDDLSPEHGCRAFDVNEQGHVLVMDTRAVLWNFAEGTWHYVGDDRTNVFPIALTDDDVVLGQARNRYNQPVAVVCRPGGGWERLGTPDNWIPIAMNNAGLVIGRTSVDQLTRPWLHRPDGQTTLLPYVSDHHTTPAAINNLGDIVGGASADNDTHALLWRVRS